MPSYRLAIRRTQKEVDAEKVNGGKKFLATTDRKTLQRLAKERGIPANQSTEALREALS